jgi:protein-S-isoprenylcysteine O-methyltransferase Ste14
MRPPGILLGVSKAVALVGIWFSLRWLAVSDVSGAASAVLIVAPLVLVVPASWGGRKVLDAHPGRVMTVTAVVDLVVIVLFGLALVEGIRTGMAHPGWRLPVPASLGLLLMWVLGPVVALTVINLAVRGLGAPFAAPISRRLATGWLYRYTRNPMVLAVLLFLFAMGLWRGQVVHRLSSSSPWLATSAFEASSSPFRNPPRLPEEKPDRSARPAD